jgi:sulfoxide reductase heme-binding subunit YedZ
VVIWRGSSVLGQAGLLAPRGDRVRRFAKPAVFVLCLVPFLWLAVRAARGELGVNPIEEITLVTGRWTLRFLLVTLAVTPVRRLLSWNAIIGYRRMLGLFAFFYASLHFCTYLVLDQFFDWQTIVEDVTERPFIMAGAGALALLIPLAVTSTRGWIRRLGRNWARLHMIIYPAAILAVTHFIWKVKSDLRSPMRYAVILGVLLVFRVVWRVWSQRRVRTVRRVRPVRGVQGSGSS